MIGFFGGLLSKDRLASDISAETRVMMILQAVRGLGTWTSARQVERELDRSMIARFEGLLRSDRLASEMSAITRVIIILEW